MKRKRISVEQIVAALNQAQLGMQVADLIRQVGISEQTVYRWKKVYAGMESDQVGGTPLHVRLRYFDPEARRPGVPPDVAALVQHWLRTARRSHW